MRLGIFAVEDIKKGTELCYNYEFEYHEGSGSKKCCCGADNCKGII